MAWGYSLLSQGASEVLIKSVAQAIHVYVMGVLKLSFSVCDDLMKLIETIGGAWNKVNRRHTGSTGLR